MSQAAFLRQFDAAVFGAFRDAGIGDDARYTAPEAGASLPCVVLVDRDVADYGAEIAPVATRRVVVTFRRADFQPVRRGRVVVGTDSYLLDELLSEDESATRWVVTRG